MMNRHRFSGTITRQPAKSVTQRSARLLRLTQMLMRPLQRRQREAIGRGQFCFTHSVPLARAVTMQRDQQRRRLHSWRDDVVVQIDLRRKFTLAGLDVWFIHAVTRTAGWQPAVRQAASLSP